MEQLPDFYTRGLTYVLGLIVRHVRAFLLLVAGLTLVAAVYSAWTVHMNSDYSTLVARDAPFREDYRDYTRAFPELDEAMLVVVTSASLDRAEDATKRLAAALLQRTDIVSTVFAPSIDPFFNDHALLYLDQPALERVVRRLTAAQPMLAALAVDPSLRGLFDQLDLGLSNVEDGTEKLPTEFPRIAKLVSEAAESLVAGTPRKIVWMDELMGSDDTVYRVITVQGRKFFTDEIATGRLVEGVRQTVSELGLTPESGVQVRLTGMGPLVYEEQATLRSSLTIAAPLSAGLLVLLLAFGLRSPRIIAAIFVTIFVTLTWTTAWAMLTVGEFNTISAAFAVLLIGLGDDYGVHIGLRYEEQLAQGKSIPEAVHSAVTGAGGGVALCALTSSVAFLSFVPTPYKGLAALGIITAGGLAISLFTSLTVFPALLSVIHVAQPKPYAPPAAVSRLEPFIARHATAVVIGSAALALIGLYACLRITFDFNTLGMKDPKSESMTTLRDLQDQGMFTDYSATVLAPSLASAETVAARLAALKEVKEARPPSFYLPKEQQAKLELIQDTAFLLEPALHPVHTMPPPSAPERLTALQHLRARIAAMAPAHRDDPAWPAIDRLGVVLDRVAAQPDAESKAADLEQLVISDLGERIAWLGRALEVSEVKFADLPEGLRRRLVSSDGRVRIVALPRENVGHTEALAHFVDAVATVAPHATGRPAIEKAIGDVVVESFRWALTMTLIMVAGILIVALRDPGDALMALIPISLGALLTVAFGVIAGIPFNMANVVVIPLVLGMSVDNGIHVLMRFREEHGSLSEVMESSTPRAIVLSTLTTLAAFGSMAVSAHVGLHSMGVLLSVALLCSMLTTLTVLPAMITLRESWRRRRRMTARGDHVTGKAA
jgi:uncharacterized protein